MKDILHKYEELFQCQLLEGLKPRREIDHAIETEETGKSTHVPFLQFSPAELEAVKKYIEDLLTREKIRPINAPGGGSLFFLKD